jgi:hypothetical protein
MCWAALGVPVGAQTIAGTLLEANTGAGAQGAQIVLLDSLGSQVGWRLTDAAGQFSFQVAEPGTYQLRADRIGLASILSDRITVHRGDAVIQDLEAPVHAIPLSEIAVESSSRCEVRPGAERTGATAVVWEEARKALNAASYTSSQVMYEFVLRRYEREFDARGRNVRRERTEIRRLSTPFMVPAVGDLLEHGFVRPSNDGTTYLAPDAEVLLSAPFLDTHCMSLVEGEDEARGLVGLAFEPTEDRGVPDISGVLWLDRSDGELRWLDYTYEYVDVQGGDRLGGRVRFDGLPNGTWIIREWSIRMPLVEWSIELGRRTPRQRLVGIKEEGGVVVTVNDVGGEVVLDTQRVIAGGSRVPPDLTGVSADGLGIGPESDGLVRIPWIIDGDRSFRAFDPVGECGSGDDGILVGFATHEGGEPALDAVITISWRETVPGTRGALALDRVLTASQPWDDGFFLICDVPRGRNVAVKVRWNGVEADSRPVTLSTGQRVSRWDVVVPTGR